MTLRFYGPVIFAEDIGRLKKFYVDILKQEVEHDFKTNIIFKSHLSLWKIRPDHEIAEIEIQQPKGPGFELYFETDDIKELSATIKNSGARLLHDIKTEPWGQQTIRFFDPEDNLLEVGEEMPVFVNRIYHETGSVKATAEKTGIPEPAIKNMIG